MRLALSAMLLLAVWELSRGRDEPPTDMEKKAAVDCKTVKKSNTRTMNFTDKGKEYVCRHTVEREHKLFTFFKVPQTPQVGEDEPRIVNEARSKTVPTITIKGKKFYLLGMKPRLNSSRRNKLMTACKSRRLFSTPDASGQSVRSSKSSTTPVSAIMKSAVRSGNVTKQTADAVNSTEKSIFKIPFTSWMKLPDILSDAKTLKPFQEFRHISDLVEDNAFLTDEVTTKSTAILALDVSLCNESPPFMEEVPSLNEELSDDDHRQVKISPNIRTKTNATVQNITPQLQTADEGNSDILSRLDDEYKYGEEEITKLENIPLIEYLLGDLISNISQNQTKETF